MAATFDASLLTDKDWVRLLIGDTSSPYALQDETILVILAEVLTLGATPGAAKYCAAAQAGALVAAHWTSLGGAVAEKQVSKLRIQYTAGSATSAMDAYGAYLNTLAQKCTHASLSTPALLKAL